jgi:hypothetical protein
MDGDQSARTSWIRKEIPLWQAVLWFAAWLSFLLVLLDPLVGWLRYFLWLFFHPPLCCPTHSCFHSYRLNPSTMTTPCEPRADGLTDLHGRNIMSKLVALSILGGARDAN